MCDGYAKMMRIYPFSWCPALDKFLGEDGVDREVKIPVGEQIMVISPRRGRTSSRAEGCVDDIGNARMGKRRRMRWSPKGAHSVAVTRAAVLDGRLTVSHRMLAA